MSGYTSVADVRHGVRVEPAENTQDILWLLKRTFYYARESVNDALSRHGVSTAQIGLMNQLADEPGLSGAELARRLLITPQAAQLALAALERRGIVERRRDPHHGRILRAYLTDQGLQMTSVCRSDAVAAHDRLFSVLADDDQEELRRLLRRIVDQGAEIVDLAPQQED